MSGHCNISVIIAAYNAEKVIGTAIQSILAQSRQASEIIVVDDGSGDRTAEVVRGFGEQVLYVYQENAGVSAARNAGAATASGDWLVFLDVDDRYYSDRIETHCALVSSYPDADFVVGNYDFVSPQGEIRTNGMHSTLFGREIEQRCDENGFAVLRGGADLGRLISGYFGHTLSIGIRRDMFRALSGFPVGYRVGEDLHLLIRLCFMSRSVAVACRPMGAYVVHDAGLVRSDTVFAQEETVRTLATLRRQRARAEREVWKNYLSVLRGARYDWASALLRQGRGLAAMRAMAPALYEMPEWRSLKMLASVIKG